MFSSSILSVHMTKIVKETKCPPLSSNLWTFSPEWLSLLNYYKASTIDKICQGFEHESKNLIFDLDKLIYFFPYLSHFLVMLAK